jgi:hypothetical protein
MIIFNKIPRLGFRSMNRGFSLRISAKSAGDILNFKISVCISVPQVVGYTFPYVSGRQKPHHGSC